MNKKQPNSQPATARIPLPVFDELVKTYGLQEGDRSLKHYVASIALRLLEEAHPSEFKYAWALDWPKGKGQTISIHRNIPAVVWYNIKVVWPLNSPSAMLRTGLYIMWAKRFDSLARQDRALEDDVRRGIKLLEERRKQDETLGYHLERHCKTEEAVQRFEQKQEHKLAKKLDIADADERELQLLAELEQQSVLPVGLTVVKK